MKGCVGLCVLVYLAQGLCLGYGSNSGDKDLPDYETNVLYTALPHRLLLISDLLTWYICFFSSFVSAAKWWRHLYTMFWIFKLKKFYLRLGLGGVLWDLRGRNFSQLYVERQNRRSLFLSFKMSNCEIFINFNLNCAEKQITGLVHICLQLSPCVW